MKTFGWTWIALDGTNISHLQQNGQVQIQTPGWTTHMGQPMKHTKTCKKQTKDGEHKRKENRENLTMKIKETEVWHVQTDLEDLKNHLV